MGADLFYSTGEELGAGIAIRPVVVLENNVTDETIKKIPDQTLEDWTKFERATLD